MYKGDIEIEQKVEWILFLPAHAAVIKRVLLEKLEMHFS